MKLTFYMNTKRQRIKFILSRLFLVAIFATTAISCSESTAKLPPIENFDSIAQITSTNTKIIYSDSAKVKMVLTSPMLQKFLEGANPRTEFPNGVDIVFLDKNKKITSSLKSEYAEYRDNEQIWFFSGKVITVNEQNDILRSERLYFDRGKDSLRSDTTVTIKFADGNNLSGTGFRSSINFSDTYEFDNIVFTGYVDEK